MAGVNSKKKCHFGPENWFLGSFWSKIHVDPTLGAHSSARQARLGVCDTPLDPYARWLQEYAKKTRKRSGSWRARAKILPKMARFWVFLEFWGPKWAQKYPILLVELLEMAITTFPAILSQIRDGSIFVKIARGYPCKISRKLTRHRFGPKSQGR